MALHITAEDGATIKAGLVPSASGQGLVTLDSDGIIIMNVDADLDQVVRVEATKGTSIATDTFKLKDLVLEPEA